MGLFDDIKVSDLPDKIEHKNILNAVIEVQYVSDIKAEIVTWALYEKIKENYNIPKVTSFGKIPQEIRTGNPELRNQVLYNIESNDGIYTIGIGDGVFSLSLSNFKYDSWEGFLNVFNEVFDILKDGEIHVKRVDVRYINVFAGDLVNNENFTFDFVVRKNNLLAYPLQTVFEFKIDNRIARVNIVNQAKYFYMEDGIQINKDNALALDIDVIYVQDVNKNNICDVLIISQLAVKKIFFGMCKEKFIKNVLKPKKG